MAADAAFYSANNEAAAEPKGVKRVRIPNRATKGLERKREQRWFRDGQKWRTGCEGRISAVKTAKRPRSLPLQGRRRNGPLGRPRRHRRQRRQDLSRHRKERDSLSRPHHFQARQSQPVAPAGFALPGAIDQNAASVNFAPGSSKGTSLAADAWPDRGRGKGRGHLTRVE